MSSYESEFIYNVGAIHDKLSLIHHLECRCRAFRKQTVVRRGSSVVSFPPLPDPLPRGEREYCCPEALLQGIH
jgi:hypothetical protein